MYLNNEDDEKSIKERAKVTVEMANQLLHKFQSMGIKRKSVLKIGACLADSYFYADDIRKEIELLLETPESDWDTLQEHIVGLRVRSRELKYNITESLKPLEYLAEYCDKFLPDDDE